MAKFGFTPDEVPENNYDLIPPGSYTVYCTEAEERVTQAGTGSYIKATFVVAEGQYANRKLWHNFNINNPNETAQNIGRRELLEWAKAAGLPDADDTDDLLNRPFAATIKIEKGTGGYDDQNRIGSFGASKSGAGSKGKSNVSFAAERAAAVTPSATVPSTPADPVAPPPDAAEPASPPPSAPTAALTGGKKNPWD